MRIHARTTDGTGASPEQFDPHHLNGVKSSVRSNAVAESFFATIKRELIDRRAWPTVAGLHRAVFDWIEGWYNTRRLHSSLGYLSPAQYEARVHQNPSCQAA